MNYIDLFSGAGGLSEGFRQIGLTPIAHVESDKNACLTQKTRETFYYLKKVGKENKYWDYIKGNITQENLYKILPENLFNSIINLPIGDKHNSSIFEKIDGLIKDKSVNIIIGGPPCQAYSLIGRAKDKDGMKNDPRNYLYQQYVLFLERYTPEVFVFENVQGLKSANNGAYLADMEKRFLKAGYKMECKQLIATDFNVLQKRKRLIIIGWKESLNFKYPIFENINPKFIVQDLLEDLPKLKSGEGKHLSKYTKKTNDYLEKTEIRNCVNFVSQHIARPHNERDLQIYKIAVDLWNNKKERLKYNNLPEHLKTHNNQKSFLDRFKVVDASGYSHTLMAHISKDGHYYIHPDRKQNRSISVREAARIQSFPDNFHFEGGRTAAFKQIGNAVPPLMAKKIAKKILEQLNG